MAPRPRPGDGQERNAGAACVRASRWGQDDNDCMVAVAKLRWPRDVARRVDIAWRREFRAATHSTVPGPDPFEPVAAGQLDLLAVPVELTETGEEWRIALAH